MKAYDRLRARHRQFIAQQKMFFVGTAPLSGDGHINVSPKGYDSFAIIDDTRVAYVDLGGSGVETYAHAQEPGNGRICMMFCAFANEPLILRLYGAAQAHPYGSAAFSQLIESFPATQRNLPCRAIVEVALTRVQDSCGWGVPYFDYKGDRQRLREHNGKFGQDEFIDRVYNKNSASIDDLPGVVR